MTENGRKRRGNSRFIFFFFLIIIVLGCLTWAGYEGLSRVPWLSIKKFSISGNEYISAATINEMLRGYMGANLVDVSSGAIRKQLLKLKRIENVRIYRLFPNTLKLKITERKGFVYLKSKEGDLFPVDENGMIIEYAVYPSKEDLPIVHSQYPSQQLHAGRVISDAFMKRVIQLQTKIIAEKPDFLKSISEYYLDNGSVVIVDATYGTRVLVSYQDLSDQIRRYQFVQENGDIDRKNILDLRFKNQVIIRPEVR
jgi:cell division protein FtsQ